MCPFLEDKNLYGGYLQFYPFYFKTSMFICGFLTFTRIYHMPCSTCLNVAGSSIKCEILYKMLIVIKLSVAFHLAFFRSDSNLGNLHVTLGSFIVKVCLMGMASLYI